MCKLSKEHKIVERRIIELKKEQRIMIDKSIEYDNRARSIQEKMNLLQDISKEISNTSEEK